METKGRLCRFSMTMGRGWDLRWEPRTRERRDWAVLGEIFPEGAIFCARAAEEYRGTDQNVLWTMVVAVREALSCEAWHGYGEAARRRFGFDLAEHERETRVVGAGSEKEHVSLWGKQVSLRKRWRCYDWRHPKGGHDAEEWDCLVEYGIGNMTLVADMLAVK
jgi:hypothetical protein